MPAMMVGACPGIWLEGDGPYPGLCSSALEIATSKVEFLRYAVPPHTLLGPFPAHATGTIEHIHLAAGRLRITSGAEAAILEAGDACTCLTDAPHGFDNRDSDIEALIYLVIDLP